MLNMPSKELQNQLSSFIVAVKAAKTKLKGELITEQKTPHLNWCRSEENLKRHVRVYR